MCAPLLLMSLRAQTITVTPANSSIGAGFTQQFTATVAGLSSTGVTWSVQGMGANNPKAGVITATGLYTAPATLPAQDPVTIQALGSDGKTVGTTYLLIKPLGPMLTSVSPNPLPAGSYNITVNGSGFVSGAEIFVGGVQLSTKFVSATQLSASGWQGNVTSTVVKAMNPGSLFSNSLTVPVGSASTGGGPITVSPSTAQVALGATQQFTASGQTSVTWTASEGTITATGLVKAPATMPVSSAVTITASGTNSQKGTAIVTLTGGTTGGGPITVSPSTAQVALGATLQFAASGQSTVTWTASAGTISSAGLFKAPATMPASSTVTITASGTNNQSGTATVTLTGGAITVSPSTAQVVLGATQQFTASGQTTVTWSASAGTISSTGLFKAPATMPASSTVTITASGANNQSGTATVTLTGGAITVSPSTAQVVLGATQQFTASGQSTVTWAASAGTISATGLFKAPAAMPASSTVTVTASGTNNQSGTATVTLIGNQATPTIQSISLSPLPIGVFTFNVAGTNFTAQSVVQLNGSPLATTFTSATALAVTGSAAQNGQGNLTVVNGSSASAPFAVQIGAANPQVSAAAARRFLEQAGFGPSTADAAHVQSIGFQAWLNEQFAMPKISNYSGLGNSSQGGLPNWFLANAVTNADQLRQRVAFALSQISVISITKLIWNNNIAPFEEMLSTDAFTTYRQILGDVTLSGPMGGYLDMANNAAANPAQGTVANENYARELMQLFSLGTNLLNQDGSLQTDSTGNPIPTYNQTNVTELARVFTGWTYAQTAGTPAFWGANIDGGTTDMTQPMVAIPAYHDFGSKNLLNGYVAVANLTPAQDLQAALDNIFNHPNIGPFIGKQMIQHLVKSNPSPAYVARVAAAFANNGQGVRGDMKAVLTAVLLDPEARANDNGGSDQAGDGHMQEPALYLAGIVRAFNGSMNSQNYFASDLATMGEDIFNPASVFNYFSPGYVVPTTALKGPEFQIFTPFTSLYRANLISGDFNNYSGAVQTYGPGMTVDFTNYVALAGTPSALVDALDITLTHGVMPAAMKQIIVTAVQGETGGNLRRVQTALYLITASNYYNVWH